MKLLMDIENINKPSYIAVIQKTFHHFEATMKDNINGIPYYEVFDQLKGPEKSV